MNERVLSGTKLVIVSSMELVRAEAFASLSIDGWEGEAVFPEDVVHLRKEVANYSEEAIVVILEQNIQKFQEFVQCVRSIGIDESQIVIGIPVGSIIHRAFVKSGIAGFQFQISASPTGLKIDLSSLASSLLDTWQKRNSLLLNRELEEFMATGALFFLKLLSNIQSTSILKERAHLSHSLASYINASRTFRTRVVRYSLFGDLTLTDEWGQMITETRKLWIIKDLIEFKLKNINGKPRFPLEIAIVEVSTIVQEMMKVKSSWEQLEGTIKHLSQNLALEDRASLILSTEACFKKVWSQVDGRKKSNTG